MAVDEKALANYMRMSGMKRYKYDYEDSYGQVSNGEKVYPEKDQRGSTLKAIRKNMYEDNNIYYGDPGVESTPQGDAVSAFTQDKSSINYEAVYNNMVTIRNQIGPDEIINDGLVLKLLSHKMSERLETSLKGNSTTKMNNDRKDEFIYNISSIAPGETIINKDFLGEIRFDGYEVNLDGDDPSKKHLFFNMGLGFGESAVLNPLFQAHPNDDLRTHPRYTKIGRLHTRIHDSQVVLSIMPGSIKYNTGLLRLIGLDGGVSGATASYIRNGGEGLMAKLGQIGMAFGDMAAVVAAVGSPVLGGSKIAEHVKQPNLYRRYFDNLVLNTAIQMGLYTATSGYVGKYSQIGLNTIMPGISLRYYTNWSKAWNYNHILKYRISNQISVSENFGNSTTSNPLMDSLNSESTEQASDNATGNLQSSLDGAQNMFSAVLSGDKTNMINAGLNIGKKVLAKGAAGASQITMIKGGKAKMTFPSTYESSSFSRSYTFNMEFFSPYGDKLSIFENTYVPTLSLLALALPRQIGGFTYIEPFAVKAIVPGQVNINLGIIEGLSLERGGETNEWTHDNLPRTIKCGLQIQDMEPNMLLPLGSRSLFRNITESLMPASGLSEYLNVMAGLSLEETLDWRRNFRIGFRKWNAQMRNSIGLEDLQASIAGNQIVSNMTSLFGIIGQGNLDPSIEEGMDNGMIATTDPRAKELSNGAYGLDKSKAGGVFSFVKGLIPNIHIAKQKPHTTDQSDFSGEAYGTRLGDGEYYSDETNE